MKIQQIRSATIKVHYGGQIFLIDPWLESVKVGLSKPGGSFTAPLCDLPVSVEEIVGDVDVCLPSHLHYDHYSPELLPKDMKIIYQNKAEYCQEVEKGFTNAGWFETDTLQYLDVTIHRVDGRHGDNDAVVHRMGAVSGYIFIAPSEKTLYIAGDTVFYEGVELVIKQYDPAVIVVNSCDAKVPDGRLIMNTEDVIAVCRSAPKAAIIASHMDTVRHRHLTRQELREHLTGTAYEQQVLIPEDGEILSF